MITLNITIGGNLLIELDGKSAKKELKEIIEKATNTDAILGELLEISRYTGNDWYTIDGVLTEIPLVAHGAVFEDGEDFPRDYKYVWGFTDYMVSSFSEILLKEGKVIFKRA